MSEWNEISDDEMPADFAKFLEDLGIDLSKTERVKTPRKRNRKKAKAQLDDLGRPVRSNAERVTAIIPKLERVLTPVIQHVDQIAKDMEEDRADPSRILELTRALVHAAVEPGERKTVGLRDLQEELKALSEIAGLLATTAGSIRTALAVQMSESGSDIHGALEEIINFNMDQLKSELKRMAEQDEDDE